MLSIEHLRVSIDNKEIIKGLDLSLGKGEVHAIMGPNGSGKSTLAATLAGKEGYDVSEGTIRFMGKDLQAMSPEERACEGLFLAFQYPVEIPGLACTTFLKTALNEIRKYKAQAPLDTAAFLKHINEKAKVVHINTGLLKRPLNEGFSGGEKKQHEILQMAVLEPRLSILDETDSGLDIDALRTVAYGVNKLRSKESTILLITHYQRLLNHIIPDHVHVLYNGNIIKSGDKDLALALEEKGYEWVIKAYAKAS